MTEATASARPTLSARIGTDAVIAVVDVIDAGDAGELATVLAASGIAALEITMRSAAALPALAAAAAQDALPVGAGTVLCTDHAIAAVEHGAQFLVSPGYDADLARHTATLDIAHLPGVLTPSEIQTAISNGYSELKLFPVERFGGLALIDTFAPVFPGVRFVPSGGIDHDRAEGYLRHSSVTAIGGSWIAPAALVRDHDWTEIARRADAIRGVQATLGN